MATNRCNRRCGRQRKPGNATVQENSWNEIHSATEDGEVELLKLDVEGSEDRVISDLEWPPARYAASLALSSTIPH